MQHFLHLIWGCFLSVSAFAIAPAVPCQDAGIYGFSGGTPVPAQLVGTFGPGVHQKYDTGQQQAVGPVGHAQLLTGFPNGVTTILWGPGEMSPGDNLLTPECNTGWGCVNENDPSKIWQTGVIFHAPQFDNNDIEFCHVMTIRPEILSGKKQMVLTIWELHWPLSETHKCPDTILEALANKGPYKDHVSTIKAPYTKPGTGMSHIPHKFWHCRGQVGGVKSFMAEK